jgi:tetratricopeptide (TPR) repeat protein
VLDFATEDYPGASSKFAALENSSAAGDRFLGHSAQTRLLVEEGRYGEALRDTQEALDDTHFTRSDADRGFELLDRAESEWRLGQFKAVWSDVQSALQLNRSPDAAILASDLLGRMASGPQPSIKRVVIALLAGMERKLTAPGQEHPGLVYEIAQERVLGERLLLERKEREALKAFQRAAAIDAPATTRDYLRRGLEAAANGEMDKRAAQSLREAALEASGRTALRPAAIWRDVWSYYPGIFTDEAKAYVRIARQLHIESPDVSHVQERLEKVRGTGPV